MASHQAAPIPAPSAQLVGNAFVHQYYHILHHSPDLVHRFYQDVSKLGRPEAEGTMSLVTTMQAIDEKVRSLDYSESRAEIKTVDAQDSLNGGVLVLVTGHLTGKDNVRRNFTQSFFLAPQDKGYFVLNDLFRYMEDVEYIHEGNRDLVNDINAPFATNQDTQPVVENEVSEQNPLLPEQEVNEDEVYNPSENGDGSVVEEEMPVEEVVDEVPNVSDKLTDSSATVIQEEAPKKSYASIVMKESTTALSVSAAAPTPTPTPAPIRPPHANQERPLAPPPVQNQPAEIATSSSNATDNGSFQEAESDGYSIYIKNLPVNATPIQLEEEFKKFGPIKSGGIQVRSNKQQGFCFGFVEFEVAGAVQSAIEASPIMIGGRQAHVEEKRASSSRVNNNRGRFQSGRGGAFRNDGGRGGRGNYGGNRNYVGRGDFTNRNDFGGNRGSGRGFGGSSGGRGNDGGYGRINRPMDVNATPKNVAPRVSASA